MTMRANVNYHIKRPESQAFYFEVDGIEGNIIAPELITTEVDVDDIRDKPNSLNFDKHGISFVRAPSAINTFENKPNWQSRYEQEITQLLTQEIAATEVIVFDHTVRIDDALATRQPARNVHNDYSELGANQRLHNLLGQDKAAEFQQGHFGFVNIWRPIENPITSSPLGFIHPNSINNSDWMNIELIYPDRQGQILGASYNPNHKWFYLSEMTPDEVAIFSVYDNHRRLFLAHSALDVVEQTPLTSPRKSIETRTLVRYD